jgi:hypothetical protein
MAKKSSMWQVGGALTLLGSLIYLYVFFTWYGGGAPAGGWLSAAQFLAPLIVGFAVFSAVSLFFKGLGTLMGKMSGDAKMAKHYLWKFIMVGAISFLIITGGSTWFWWVFVAFVLTYLGGISGDM